jgi:Tfp pilus assembly major pilin PilA
MASNVYCKQQRGITLVGLMFTLAIMGFVAIVALKTVPAYAEYSAVKDAIAIAKETGGTVREMQVSFDKNADINNIEAITGRDLVISKETGETEISFAYEKRIPVIANVSLLFDFTGTTDKSGAVAQKPATE